MFNVNQVERMPLRDLVSLQGRLADAITKAKVRERSEVMEEMKRFAEKRGFSVKELLGDGLKKRYVSRPKYQNPENKLQTWTGMGRKPNWLIDKIASGKQLADFLA